MENKDKEFIYETILRLHKNDAEIAKEIGRVLDLIKEQNAVIDSILFVLNERTKMELEEMARKN